MKITKIFKKIFLCTGLCLISNTLTSVNLTPLPAMLIQTDENEETSEYLWFKSSLSQTVALEDLLDVTKTFLLSRSEIAAKKGQPWFKIGGRSPYLLALFKDPYRIVEFFLGKESWPSGMVEETPFDLMYTFSFPDVFLELYFSHPQNVLIFSKSATDASSIGIKAIHLDPKNAAAQEALLEYQSYDLAEAIATPSRLFTFLDGQESSVEPRLLFGSTNAFSSQEDRVQEEIHPEIFDEPKECVPKLSEEINEHKIFCDAQNLQEAICAREGDGLYIEHSSSNPTQTQKTSVPTGPNQDIALTKNKRISHTFFKKSPCNIQYSGPRRRPRICECAKDSNRP